MSDISRPYGDTRRVTIRITTSTGTAVDLTGWTALTLVVGQTPDTVLADRLMSTAGTVIDAAAGRVSFPVLGTVPVGEYYYNCRALDANNERTTFKTGRYIVTVTME